MQLGKVTMSSFETVSEVLSLSEQSSLASVMHAVPNLSS